MNLALFDIDGTLTQTNEVDGRCFEQALADTFEITGINSDWASYSHTTDSAILADLIRARFGRAHQLNDVSDFVIARRCSKSMATETAYFRNAGAFQNVLRLSRSRAGHCINTAVARVAALKFKPPDSLGDFPHDRRRWRLARTDY